MYEILELYAKPYDPEIPVVSLDEKCVELRDDVRKPLRLKARRIEIMSTSGKAQRIFS